MSGGYATFEGSSTMHAFKDGRILSSEKVDWISFFDDNRPRRIDPRLWLTLDFDDVVFCTKFNHSGKFLAIGCNRTHIYDVVTSERIMTMPPRKESEDDCDRSVCFSLDDKYLAVGSDDGLTRVRTPFLEFRYTHINSNMLGLGH